MFVSRSVQDGAESIEFLCFVMRTFILIPHPCNNVIYHFLCACFLAAAIIFGSPLRDADDEYVFVAPEAFSCRQGHLADGVQYLLLGFLLKYGRCGKYAIPPAYMPGMSLTNEIA